MKRIGAILSLILIMAMVLSGAVFAAGDFSLDKTSPADGDTNKSIDNFGIKLYFNQPVLNEENAKHNAKCIKVTDPEGEVLPVTIYYSPKEEGLAMALVEPENQSLVKQDAEYTVTVSSKFLSAAGDELGEDVTIKFSTLNQSRATTVNMVMMGVMMVGMVIFTTKSMKKDGNSNNQAKQQASKGDSKVNPYKVAKETGKSIEEIVEKDKKDKEKKAAREAKKEAKHEAELAAAREKLIKKGEISADDDKKTSWDVKRVKGPRPISAAGSKYVTGKRTNKSK